MLSSTTYVVLIGVFWYPTPWPIPRPLSYLPLQPLGKLSIGIFETLIYPST